MQNKNHTIIIILPIILIIIAGYIAFFKDKTENSAIYTLPNADVLETNPVTDTDKKPAVEKKTDTVVKKDNILVPDPTPKPIVNQVLQTIFNKNKNGKIAECEYNGEIHYSTSMNAYDGGGSTFDSNGNVVGVYQGFTGGYTGIVPTNCKDIYVVYPNIWGLPAVNVYNLK